MASPKNRPAIQSSLQDCKGPIVSLLGAPQDRQRRVLLLLAVRMGAVEPSTYARPRAGMPGSIASLAQRLGIDPQQAADDVAVLAGDGLLRRMDLGAGAGPIWLLSVRGAGLVRVLTGTTPGEVAA